ncbi:MAG: class I SAM-dependent methyltransferase [Hyphomicrobiaceae bacterium]|nr:class I SAM-dependent methyltransferase [Hyphomicrobiaceae bacterium]
MDAGEARKPDPNTDWGGVGGRNWVEAQSLVDEVLRSLEELLVEPLAAMPSSRVLDVGCGTGSTTLAAARKLGAEGHCVGIDISEPMLAAAQARIEEAGAPASFIQADAQAHEFEPAGFDLVISRFGVMFFEDFAAAFTNLRGAVKPGGALRMIAWRGAEHNSFMTTAERAAGHLLPNLPPRQKGGGPGQFAFAEHARVHAILEAGGWTGIDIRPTDFACSFPESELARYVSLLGPIGRVLHEADEQTRAKVVELATAAFEPYIDKDRVRFTAACWLIEARNAGG